MSTWYSLLQETAAALQKNGIENWQFEAEILLAEIGSLSRSELYFRRDTPVDAAVTEAVRQAAKRRAAHEPLQYITGTAPFRDLDLAVTPSVLIPRPETELLVDEIFKHLPQKGNFADIGTGSGAIALAVASERPDAAVTAVDASPEALEIARRNCGQLALTKPVEFLCGDLTAPLAGRFFDVIAANLPYVSEDEYALCAPEVREHEPVMALVAADDGLALILRLIKEAKDVLVPSGWLLLEMGCTQGKKIAEAMRKNGYCEVAVLQDLTGRDRFTVGRTPGSGRG